MDISTIINIVLCILSFLLAVVSVVTVVITLRQNSVMLENSSRAYLAVYGDIICCQNLRFYIVLKNFGCSSAFITSMQCDVDLHDFSYGLSTYPFSHIENSSLAPNQKLFCGFNHLKLFNNGISEINFTICYTSNNKCYTEKYCINLDTYTQLIRARSGVKDRELEAIAHGLEELSERLL